MDQLPVILGGVILAAILWLLKGTSDNGRALAVLQSTIETHILPEISRLRESGHATRNIAQTSLSAGELNGQRLDQVEEDIRSLWDGEDRRGGSDRRKPIPT